MFVTETTYKRIRNQRGHWPRRALLAGRRQRRRQQNAA